MDTDGTGHALLNYQVNIIPGVYTIKAEFPTDTDYLSSSDSKNLTINKKPTSIAIQFPVNGTYNHNIILTATLTNGSHTGGQLIHFLVNGVEVGTKTTNNAGVAVLNYLIDLPGGSYSLQAVFNGDISYEASSSTLGVLNVSKDNGTLIVAPLPSTVYHQSIPITAMLGNVTTPAGQIIHFLVDGVEVGTAPTNAMGVAVYNYYVNIKPLVNHNISATWAGNQYYYPATSSLINLNVNKATSSITLDQPGATIYHGVLHLNAHLESNGGALVSRTVKFLVDGKEVGTKTTDSSGNATYDYWVTLKPLIAHNISITWVGDDYYNADTTTPMEIDVNKANSNISVTNPVVTYYHGFTNLEAHLSNTDTDLSNQVVHFLVDGNEVGSGTTDLDGNVSYTYHVISSGGLHTIAVYFAGNDYYKSSLQSIIDGMTVKPAPTNLSVPTINGYVDDNVNISATITEKNSQDPVCDLLLSFNINGKTFTGLTDDNGVVNIKVTPTEAGTYIFNTDFGGNTNYLSISKESDMVIKKHPTVMVLNPASAEKWHDVTINANLTTANQPVSERKVEFYLNNDLIGSCITDESGNAQIKYLLEIPYGFYPITAKFACDRCYDASEYNNSLEVQIPRYPNVLQVENEGQGTVYILYRVKFTKADGETSNVVLGGYIEPGNVLNFELGTWLAGTSISIDPVVYDRSGIRIYELSLINRIIIDGQVWYEQPFIQHITPTNNNNGNQGTNPSNLDNVVQQDVVDQTSIDINSYISTFILKVLEIFNSPNTAGGIFQPFLNFFNWLILAQGLLNFNF
jgi:hypothetical protein